MPTKKAVKQTNKRSSGQSHPFVCDFMNDAQGLAWAAFQQHEVLFLVGPAGTGKAQPIDSILYAKNGPIRMGDVAIGDEIAAPDGTFCKVMRIFPQGEKQVYRVIFSDDTSVECCEDHLWMVSSISNGWKDRIVDAKFLAENHKTISGRRKLYIRATKPVQFERKQQSIPPYILGILISEGNLTNANVVFTSSDDQILKEVELQIRENYCCKSKGIDHRIVKRVKNNKANEYKESLKQMGLWGKLSYEKHIPNNYLFGSVDQRISLLQGLMDGDGTVEKTGSVSFSTSSERLAKDFCQLIYSLGGTTRIKMKKTFYRGDDGKKIECRPSHRCYLNLPEVQPFLLTRKSQLVKLRKKYFPKRIIESVEVLNEKKEMQCILVDREDHLYLTDNFTATHNTHLACAFAVEQIRSKQRKKIIITRPIVEAGESLGYLPGELEEKIHPYMVPMHDCLNKIVGHQGPEREKVNKCLEAVPLAYMRGRSFDDAICIFDEAQNASMLQLKMFLTRFGKNSKIIITGDPMQSDLGGEVALINVMNRLIPDVEGVGKVHFGKSAIVRHPLVGKIIEKLEE